MGYVHVGTFVGWHILIDLQSEASLVSVLAHELGHIELGHCFEAAKFQLLARKVGAGTYGQLADFVVNALVRHSFSKTVENEADEYAYALILHTDYDPRGVGNAFAQLLRYQRGRGARPSTTRRQADILRDYFMSHPPLELRREKFGQRALAWWRRHPNSRRFIGKRNLARRTSYYQRSTDQREWVTDSSQT